MTVMDSRNLRLGGDSTWTSGGIRFHSTASITNEAGNTFTTDFDGSTGIVFGGTGTFNNEGIFTKSGGTGTTSFNSTSFNNTGIVNVNSGTLALNGGGTQTGNFSVSNGTTLSFNGTHTLNAGTSFSGAGAIQFTGGSLTVNAAVATPASMAFSMSGAALNGAGTLTVDGPLTWSGGTMNGVGTLNATGGANLSGGTKFLADNRVVNLGGTSTWKIQCLAGLKRGDFDEHEVREVLIQATPYVGYPRAAEFVGVTEEAIAEYKQGLREGDE